jgi:acetyl-CoA carboxylase biotin carboxyl carrier protein
MELTHEDVLEILQLIERSSVDYLEVEVGGNRVVADRTGQTVTQAQPIHPGPPAQQPSTPATAAAASPPNESARPAPTGPGPEAPAVAAQPTDEVTADGLATVVAPVVGVFYRAPEPGADPYVEVGSRVEVGATLGLVEVMKMFNSVTADVAGEVTEILAENEEFVEHGQAIIRIRPEPDA